MDLNQLLSVEPFDWPSISTAILCGGIIGFERQLRGKPVGIRTSALIVLGTYMFIAASMLIKTEFSDPSRIIGQVVTGVGFLGAGVMLAKEGVVVGVTSAATIWVLAGVGVIIAVISPIVAIKFAVLIVGILYGVDVLEGYSTRFTQGAHSKINKWRKKDRRNSEHQ
ncbi:MAG: putative Mg2+ transporter-C (MgtC) family protein [Sulfitobacter sp.]|jgi:putative Mg2+ transporter-C (MgtC) family protein